MLTYSLKIRPILVLLLCLSALCHAEDNNVSASPEEKSATETQFYIVKPNETLAAISRRYGLNYVKLARLNGIPEPYNVLAGQKIKLFDDKQPAAQETVVTKNTEDELFEEELEKVIAAIPPEKSPSEPKSVAAKTDDDLAEIYQVEKNESLTAIATRFEVSVEQLAAWNNITTPDQLYAGQKLKIFKDKQKHSFLKPPKNQPKTVENEENNAEKTSIISNNNKSMLKFYYHLPTEGEIIKNFVQTGRRGIEIKGHLGQPIRAIAAGKVVAISAGIYGHGQFIVIRHDNQLLSSYANNHRSLVKNGETVTQGQVIAEMGRVGLRPPSLEFEMRKHGILVNPMQFLPKKDTGS